MWCTEWIFGIEGNLVKMDDYFSWAHFDGKRKQAHSALAQPKTEKEREKKRHWKPKSKA